MAKKLIACLICLAIVSIGLLIGSAVSITDSDNDGISDNLDKCDNTQASSGLNLTQTFGCSAEQILYCKPGTDEGELKFGITNETLAIWMNQSYWSLDCQTNNKVVREGESKLTYEDTDKDKIIDFLDFDDDNDMIKDTEDAEPESAGSIGKAGKGVPDWWCDYHLEHCGNGTASK